MHVKRDERISLAGTDLVIVNVTQLDAGSYTCELDTDDISPLSVSHQLQILGNIVWYSIQRYKQNQSFKIWIQFRFLMKVLYIQ